MVDLRMDDATLIERIEQWRRDGHELSYRSPMTGEIFSVEILQGPRVFMEDCPEGVTPGDLVFQGRRLDNGITNWGLAKHLLSGGPRPAPRPAASAPAPAREQLPIIDELERATTFSEIATWLTRCPLAIFASHGDRIEAIVKQRGFGGAAEYVAGYMATLHATRHERFKPGHWEDDDGDGTYSKLLIAAAKELDSSVRLIGRQDVSWHIVHSKEAGEAANAG